VRVVGAAIGEMRAIERKNLDARWLRANLQSAARSAPGSADRHSHATVRTDQQIGT